MADISALAAKIRHGIYWRVKRLPPFRQINHEKMLRERDYLLTKTFPQVYLKYSQQPIDPKKVIFVENRSGEVTDNFLPLLEDLKRDGSFTVHVHLLQEFTVLRREFNRNCARLAADCATAAYVFLNDTCPAISCLPMREGTTVVQLWHGCGAFKRFGHSTLLSKFGPTQKSLEKHPVYGYGNLSYVTVSSPEVAWAYEEAMELADKKTQIVATGVSRTDRFFDKEFEASAVEKVHACFPPSRGKKILLFAPTFRGRVNWASTPDFRRFDLNALHKAIGGEYVVLIKQHPFLLPGRCPKVPAHLSNFAKDVTNDLSIDELICAADVLISDYSSLIFEYSLFSRPMLFYAWDLKQYFDWRGFYYDYNELTPGPVCTTMDELIECLVRLEEQFDEKEVIAFRNKFMSACDGHATERIEQLVFGRSLKETELTQ